MTFYTCLWAVGDIHNICFLLTLAVDAYKIYKQDGSGFQPCWESKKKTKKKQQLNGILLTECQGLCGKVFARDFLRRTFNMHTMICFIFYLFSCFICGSVLGMGLMSRPEMLSLQGLQSPWFHRPGETDGVSVCVCGGGGMDGVCGYRVPSHSKVKPGQTGLELDG